MTDANAVLSGPTPPGTPRFQHAAAVLERRSLDSVLVLVPGTGDPLALSASAGRFWDCFATGATFEQAVDDLSDEFGLPEHRVRVDFRPTFDALVAVGALVPAATCSGA